MFQKVLELQEELILQGVLDLQEVLKFQGVLVLQEVETQLLQLLDLINSMMTEEIFKGLCYLILEEHCLIYQNRRKLHPEEGVLESPGEMIICRKTCQIIGTIT